MNLNEYQEKSKRTLNNDLTGEQQLSNMLFGITGEMGEVADILKKHLYQGHTLNTGHLHEEIGDTMFYIVNLCNVLGFDLEEVIAANHRKLILRYPDGFEIDKSINRVDVNEGTN